MALIEGIGDEVLQVFACLILLAIGIIAWWSTQISERPLIRTVLVLERRRHRQPTNEIQPAPSEPPPPAEDKSSEASTMEQAEASDIVTDQSEVAEDSDAISTPTHSGDSFTQATSNDGTPESRPETVSTLRNRRLAYFQEGTTNPEEPPTDGESQENSATPIEDNATVGGEEPNEPHNIRIRLKYLNDEFKLVDGNLEEQLGDFKRRHFSIELSGRKLVRLIFNGQVLGQDTWTLGHYGLFDNCVVHCLVHNPRTPPPSPNLNAREGSARQQPIAALSNVLITGLSILLGLAWYGRYHYAHLFTATTTVALFGLTGLFTVSLIGVYMPELAQT